MERHHVFFIPGLFGFGRLGDINYFHHVGELLDDELADRSIDVLLHTVHTLPTGSIEERVGTLLEKVESRADDDRPIHLVGHSTGGLDARLFVTPGISIEAADRRARFADRVRSVVSLATPHYGTPLAGAFDGFLGQNLLFVASLASMQTLRYAERPTRLVFELLGVVARLDDNIGLRDTILDQLYDDLFAKFDAELAEGVREYFRNVLEDRSALGQITPAAIELLNENVEDAPHVDYGCVATYTPPPTARTVADIGPRPYRLLSHAIFRLLRWLAGGGLEERPAHAAPYLEALERDLGTLPEPSDSDGVTPTYSQLWGELIAAVCGDHLDVCGHFSDPTRTPIHADWLVSGVEFSRRDFERVWQRIADFLAAA